MGFIIKCQAPKIWRAFRQCFMDQLIQRSRFQIIDSHDKHLADATLFSQIQQTVDGNEIIVRLVDNYSLSVLKIEKIQGMIKDVFSPQNNWNDLSLMIGKLCEKIHHIFPMATGSILKLLDDQVEIDFGIDYLMMYWPIIAYRLVSLDSPFGSDMIPLGQSKIYSKNNTIYGTRINDIWQLNITDQFITR